MIILKENIKFLIILFILLGLSLHSNFVHAAASSGDGKSAVNTAKQIREGLIKSGVTLNPLDKMKKFI